MLVHQRVNHQSKSKDSKVVQLPAEAPSIPVTLQWFVGCPPMVFDGAPNLIIPLLTNTQYHHPSKGSKNSKH